MRPDLVGDTETAGKWIGWAEAKLRQLKRLMQLSGRSILSKYYDIYGQDVRVFVSSRAGQDTIRIEAKEGGAFIVCYVGTTTGDFSSKRFYDLTGREIARDEVGYTGSLPKTPAGWRLTDDGLYGLLTSPEPDPADPWNNAYTYNPGGLGIPKCGSGISAKRQAGRSARYILNSAIEDETFQAMSWRVTWPGPTPAAYDYTYYFVRQIDSLTFAPYSIYGPRPYFTKYLGGKVVTMIVPWAGYEATFTWDAYPSDNFRDLVPKMRNIWQVNIEDGLRTAVAIAAHGNDVGYNQVAIGAAAYKDGDVLKTRIVRPEANIWLSSYMLEPIREEVYDLAAATMTPGTERHRCADPMNKNCYFIDSDTSSGYASIGNDVRVPYSIDASGKQAYVRIQKSGDFESMNTGLYCGDALVEESGWEGVLRLHADEVIGPLVVRKTRYRIIHVHAEDGYQAVVYSKTVYDSSEHELLPYTAYVASVGAQCQFRKTMIRSRTTYHVAVNGYVTNFGYENYRREYRLTIRKVAYSGPPLSAIHGHFVQIPWVDCGYNANGSMLDEDNSCVMRCDTNAAQGKLLLGFDVFPVKYRHDLAYDAHNNLSLAFDAGVVAFPPSSDARYATVKDRKWMLFGSDGQKIKDITPPQKPNNGGHVNRINGLAFIGV